MTIQSKKHTLVTVAGTQYVIKRPKGMSRKQARAQAKNAAAQADYAIRVAQAKAREAKSGIVEHVQKPEVFSAPVPNTYIRVAPQPSDYAVAKSKMHGLQHVFEGHSSQEVVDAALSKVVA